MIHKYEIMISHNGGLILSFGVCSKRSLDKWAKGFMAQGYTVSMRTLPKPSDIQLELYLVFEYKYNLLLDK